MKSPFVVETDASDSAIAAVLNQDGQPVASSRTLSGNELPHHPVEKEAYASRGITVLATLLNWQALHSGNRSTIINSDKNHSGRIKNEKMET